MDSSTLYFKSFHDARDNFLKAKARSYAVEKLTLFQCDSNSLQSHHLIDNSTFTSAFVKRNDSLLSLKQPKNDVENIAPNSISNSGLHATQLKPFCDEQIEIDRLQKMLDRLEEESIDYDQKLEAGKIQLIKLAEDAEDGEKNASTTEVGVRTIEGVDGDKVDEEDLARYYSIRFIAPICFKRPPFVFIS